MISTVTTAVAALSGSGLSAALGGVIAAALLALVAQRELATAAGPKFQPLTRNLSMTIGPLAIVFAATTISRLSGLF